MGLKTMLGLKKPKLSPNRLDQGMIDAARSLVDRCQPYQPIVGFREAASGRDHEGFGLRWEMISDVIRRTGARNYCDLGCAEGYYLYRAAVEHGLFSVGVDQNDRRLQRLSAVNQVQGWNFGFLKMTVNAESIERLPPFDIVSCMSVFHHIVRLDGVEAAREALRQIARKTVKGFIFDMGHDPAVHTSHDRDADTEAFLRSGGFTKIELLGRAPSEIARKDRPVFFAHAE